MKLLVDMNLSPHWVDRLNAAGLPAVHWSGIGRMDAPDVETMAYAAKYDYDYSHIRKMTGARVGLALGSLDSVDVT